MSQIEVPTALNYVGGKFMAALSGQTFDIASPDDGRLVACAARGEAADMDNAIAAATAALPTWAALTPADREKLFFKAADLVDAAGETFVSWLIDEGGSCLTKAKFEAGYTSAILRAAGGEARRLYGDTFPGDRNNRLSIVIREPLGVVGAISPFNAPLLLLVKMVAFPIAGGNTVVAKPSEMTPMVAHELAKIFEAAGFPPGVFNVVHGMGREAGEALVNDPRVHGITFTGSTTVGRKIAAAASGRMARVHMELGGKNPVLVLRDADLEEA